MSAVSMDIYLSKHLGATIREPMWDAGRNPQYITRLHGHTRCVIASAYAEG